MSDTPRVSRIYIPKYGYKPIIIYKRGTKFTKAAVNTGIGVKTVRLKNRDADQATDMDYPLDKAIQHFRYFAKRGKMNKEIRGLLYGNYE